MYIFLLVSFSFCSVRFVLLLVNQGSRGENVRTLTDILWQAKKWSKPLFPASRYPTLSLVHSITPTQLSRANPIHTLLKCAHS